MKMGRNDKCPCGSGLKYKKCCMLKQDDENFKDIRRISGNINLLKKQSKINQCIYPVKQECKGEIINAHSIQNNKILNRLAENGHVLMVTTDLNDLISINLKNESRNKATTFTGFCKYHDDSIFRDIEKREFCKEEKQIFLFAYRAFALEYHKKMEATQMMRKAFSKIPNQALNNGLIDNIKMHELALNDNNQIKQIFDSNLLNQKYNIFCSLIWELDYEIGFSATFMSALEYDLEGKLINDVMSTSEERLKNIFFNIFPDNKKSYILISWLNEDKEVYENFKYQMETLNDKERISVISNLIVNHTENIVISPRLWNKWSYESKEEFKMQYFMDFTFMRFELQKDTKRETGYNLFMH